MDTVSEIVSTEESGNFFHKIKTENDAEKLFGTEEMLIEGSVEPVMPVKTESNMTNERENFNEKVLGEEGIIKMDIKEESFAVDYWGYEHKRQDEDTIPETDRPEISVNYDSRGLQEENYKEEVLWMEKAHTKDTVEPPSIETENIIKCENSSREVSDEDIARMDAERRSVILEPGVGIQGGDVSCLKVEDDITIDYGDVKREETEDTQDTQSNQNVEFGMGGGDTATCKASSIIGTDHLKVTWNHECENSIACDSSKHGSSKTSSLKECLKTGSREKQLACDMCDYRCRRDDHLKSHMKIHTREKPFACDVCESRFSQACNLKTHMRVHTGEKPFACDVCGARFTRADSLKSHMNIHAGEKPFTCDVCDYRCRDGGSLKKHMRIHSQEKQLTCYICEHCCSNASKLKIHMRVHTGEKPFACDVCDFRFTDGGSLKRHMRVHSGVKPFACDVCGYRCSQPGNLKIHMRVHTREKPLICVACVIKGVQVVAPGKEMLCPHRNKAAHV